MAGGDVFHGWVPWGFGGGLGLGLGLGGGDEEGAFVGGEAVVEDGGEEGGVFWETEGGEINVGSGDLGTVGLSGEEVGGEDMGMLLGWLLLAL